MKKRFRFTIDLEAEVQEQVNGADIKAKEKINSLLKEFVKDKTAVLDLYKLWLLGDLKVDEHLDQIKESLKTRKEEDILKSVLPHCPALVRQYFLKILSSKDDEALNELEPFYEHFELLQFKGAHLTEITE